MQLNIKRLQMELDRQGLTYQTLGNLLHISRQAVGYYIYNPKTLTLKTINKLARVLKTDPKDLLI